MFDEDNILDSPRGVALDKNASEPLRLVLEDPHKSRMTKLRTTTWACSALIVIAMFVVFGYGYYGSHKSDPSFWHITLVSLLFWIGLSQGMVALSAILRLSHASWRYPLNRLLDMGSLFGLWMPLLLPVMLVARREIYALGASEYRDNVWRVSTPIGWDAVSVGTAFIAGWFLLFLTSLPDFAMLRDRAPSGSREYKLYNRLTNWRGVKWIGAEHQWRVLRRAEGVLVIGVVTSFVGSQTVLGWDFQLAAARDWDSSIFAPLYTLGSVLAAVAMAVLLMTVVNRLLRGRGFFTDFQYDSLGKFMVGLALIWTYFRICDFLTAWYGHIPNEWNLQQSRTIAFPMLVGLMCLGCSAAPIFANLFPRNRKRRWQLCVVSALVLIGIVSQRFLDTVPTFAPKYGMEPLLPTGPVIFVFFGLAAMFVLTFLIGARYFPIMSWWGTSKERTRTAERRMGNATVTVMVEDPPLWEN